MATISVIVPVYKVEAFLPRCVDSILAQSFFDFELILVDDGSPDNCGAVCDAYAARDSRVHVIHQRNGGLSAARNTGLDWVMANSDAQWIAFVDSDDWIHPDYLKLLYEAVMTTGCRLSACGFFRTSGESFPEEPEKAAEILSADDYYCGETWHGGTTAVAWNKLYHRVLLRKLRYPIGKLHEDEFVTYQAVYNAGTVAAIEKPLYAYYQNPEGIILSQWNPRRLHILEATEQQIAYAQEEENDRFRNKAVRQYIFCIHEQLNKCQKVFRKELRRKLRQALKMGREWNVFPLNMANLWAYEEAYPMKPLWWLFFKGYGLLKRGNANE